MSFEPQFAQFWEKVKESLSLYTFAKLTLAKTIGDTDLRNIYMRPVLTENKIQYSLMLRFKKEEIEKIVSLDETYRILLEHMNNPFFTALLFTTDADITFKLNKKRVASIVTQDPTFRNASEVVLDIQRKGMILTNSMKDLPL